ncbi:BEN domain-containing protein 5, partial [Frankliniella fusca]
MSEGGNSVDNSEWYAYVRYKSGRKTAYVPILDIKEKSKRPGNKKKVLFNPQTLTDFNSQEWYSVKTAQDSKDGQPHTWYAHIGKLGESLESLQVEVQEGRRIKWPVIEENESEAVSTATEDIINESDASNPDVLKNRLENRQNKKHKKSAMDSIHCNLLKDISNRLSHSSQAGASSQCDEEASEASRLRGEVEKLKSELKAKDDRLRAVSKFSEQPDLLQHLQRLSETIVAQHVATNNRILELENKFDNFIRKSEFSHDYVEAWLSQIPDHVSLGHGLECTRPVQRILQLPATEYAEWCTALLEGIFGDDAHLMRVKTTKLNPECKKFPAGFLLAAQVRHDEWLAKKSVLDGGQLRPYTPLEIAEKSKELPPYLAARSYSLYVQKKREAGELPPLTRSEAQADRPTTPKRTYISKGSVAARKRLAASNPAAATAPAHAPAH